MIEACEAMMERKETEYLKLQTSSFATACNFFNQWKSLGS